MPGPRVDDNEQSECTLSQRGEAAMTGASPVGFHVGAVLGADADDTLEIVPKHKPEPV